MKLKWGRRSLTFLIIPDANRKVVRFRVSSFLLYMVPIVAMLIVCVTLTVHLNNLKKQLENQELAAELAKKTATYEQTITVKEHTIHQLQSEIIDISSQSEEVKIKVEELEKLEDEIREVTGKEKEEESQSEDGVGGIEQELTATGTDQLIAMTKEQLSTLDNQVSMLLTDISVAKEDLIEHLHMLRVTPSIWPTVSTKISSSYGYRKDPFTRRAAYHSGVDISGDSGDPIYVAADGVVTHVGYESGHGRNVIVKHASGVSTRYSHLRKYIVKEGQSVVQGETIAELGSTGRSTGPHLHYEVIKSGDSIDPMPYLETARKDGN